jgi:ATP-dependent DNA ligase
MSLNDSIRFIGRVKRQKLKTQRTDDFWVGGYVPGNRGVDQLVVGEKRGKELYFVASVKNGFVPAPRRRVLESIAGTETDKCPRAPAVSKHARQQSRQGERPVRNAQLAASVRSWVWRHLGRVGAAYGRCGQTVVVETQPKRFALLACKDGRAP